MDSKNGHSHKSISARVRRLIRRHRSSAKSTAVKEMKSTEQKRPLVAIWRPDLEPKEISKAIALMAPSQGIDVIYICTYGMNLDKGILVGKMLKSGTDQWERRVTRMPDIVDTSSFCWTNEKGREYFEQHCWCTDVKRSMIPKSALQRKLMDDERVSRYAIPTASFRRVDDLERFAREHADIVVKPIFSSRGVGVHRVTFDAASETFQVGFKTDDQVLDDEGFRAYAREHFFEKPHIAQKYVSSRSAAGDPFDCRVHMEKNGSGEWEPASMLVRIGIGQKIISNINQGGGMAELEPFLKANRPDCWELIVERLRELAATVPAWFEEQRGVELCTLGIDVAITDEGDLHIFEINRLPFVDFNLGQVAMRRVAYYRWLADHHRGEHQ